MNDRTQVAPPVASPGAQAAAPGGERERERRGTKRGARLLTQVAANPACRLMTTAAVAGLPLPALDPAAGTPEAPGGENVSRLAMANGNRFETALWRDGRLIDELVKAKLLPPSPYVADYRRDTRPPDRVQREVLAHVRAAAEGGRVPDFLCHPPLTLTVTPTLTLALTPDYLRLVRCAEGVPRGLYVAGEIKAFHDLGPDTDPNALFAAERQVSAYDLALDRLLAALRLGGVAASADRADLVLRLPRARDLRPALRPNLDTRPHKERLRRAALPALERATAALAEFQRLHRRLPDLAELPTHLIGACANVCPAYPWCLERARRSGDLRVLGDGHELLAPATDVAAALALLARADPAADAAAAPDDPEEASALSRLAVRAAWAASLAPVPLQWPSGQPGSPPTTEGGTGR